MISLKMLGLILTIIGIGLVVTGTILFFIEPSEPQIANTFCFCNPNHSRPIYCYQSLHGIVFDLGWSVTIVGTVTMFFCRKEKLLQKNSKNKVHLSPP
jgi:uncharacterized membrane protein